MSDVKLMNRWFVVVGAILIQLCLGAIYAWSVFTPKLTAAVESGGYGFTAKQAGWVFSAGLASFAIVMVLAGRLQAAIGPRPLAIAGGVVLGVGYILGGFFGSSFVAQLVCIGLIGGAGIGLAYVVPIAVGVKWFPDKKGMITGLAVAGFGFGATLWVKLAGSWWPGGGLIAATHVFGLPGIQSVFVIYGVVFLVCVLLGSVVMVNPPAGYKPEGWNPPSTGTAGAASGAVEMTEAEMLRTPQFFLLWLMFVGSGLAGLMVIYCIKLFGIDALQAAGSLEKEASNIAGTAMAWYAILNGLGRIAWGTVSDKIGRKMALFLMCLCQGIIMLAFYRIGSSSLGLIIGACIIGFNFGGNFALFPAATADYFGNKSVGKNYGWVFLAYGVAGIAGPQVAGYFKDRAGSLADAAVDPSVWLTPFIIAGISCLVAAAIAILLTPPKRHAQD